jgi:hypothetical protein
MDNLDLSGVHDESSSKVAVAKGSVPRVKLGWC